MNVKLCVAEMLLKPIKLKYSVLALYNTLSI